jgi:hypothetical protein
VIIAAAGRDGGVRSRGVGTAARGAWRETAATPRADVPRIIGRRTSGSLSRSDVRFGRGHAKKLGLDDN